MAESMQRNSGFKSIKQRLRDDGCQGTIVEEKSGKNCAAKVSVDKKSSTKIKKNSRKIRTQSACFDAEGFDCQIVSAYTYARANQTKFILAYVNARTNLTKNALVCVHASANQTENALAYTYELTNLSQKPPASQYTANAATTHTELVVVCRCGLDRQFPPHEKNKGIAGQARNDSSMLLCASFKQSYQSYQSFNSDSGYRQASKFKKVV